VVLARTVGSVSREKLEVVSLENRESSPVLPGRRRARVEARLMMSSLRARSNPLMMQCEYAPVRLRLRVTP